MKTFVKSASLIGLAGLSSLFLCAVSVVLSQTGCSSLSGEASVTLHDNRNGTVSVKVVKGTNIVNTDIQLTQASNNAAASDE